MSDTTSWPEFHRAHKDPLRWLEGPDERLDDDALWKKWREEHRETWIAEKLRQVRLTLALGLAGLKLTLYPDGKGWDADDCFWNHFCDACEGPTAARLLARIDDEDATDQMLMGPGDGELESLYAAYRQEQERLDAEAARVEAERKAEEERRAREEVERKAEEERAQRAEAKAAKKAALELQAKQDAERLPDGLEMLALQFDVNHQVTEFDHLEAEWQNWLDSVCSVFTTIGRTCSTWRKTQTMFGPAEHVVWRVDIVATPENMQKWLGSPNIRVNMLGVDLRRRLTLKHAKRLTTLYTGEDDACFDYSHKGIDRDESKPFAEYVKAITATDADFALVHELAENCGGDPVTISEVLGRANYHQTSRPPEFLIPGLIGKKIVTLLAGAKAHGKSSLLTSLAAACARRDSEWLGMPLNASKGQAVFLSGEDPADAVLERVKAMCGSVPPLLWVIHGASLADAFETIGNRLVNCLVIDPARKFLDGNEDDSNPVSKFFDEVTDFICRKDCPGIVAHHLRRGSLPRGLGDVPGLIRGSQVWMDRPRCITGLVRRKAGSVFGITSLGGIPLHNLGTGAMEKPITLAYDPETRRHTLQKDAAPADEKEVDETESLAFAAASRLLEEGKHLSGGRESELFAYKAPELTGLSRAQVRNAVDALVEQGLLARDEDGVLSLKE